MRQAILHLGILVLAAIARAQSLDPTPDTTPPIELDGSIGPGGDVPFENDTWGIDDQLGEYRGRSLFHSFGRFDVPSGQSAEFSASGGVPGTAGAPPDRVFARVTWGERSDVEGTLRSSIPGADLYLINPAGVRFAGDAQLDVQGSFHAASAGRIDFPSGASFDASAPAPLPLLEFGDPSAYGFLPEGGASIEFGLLEAGPLRVPAGETLAAVGGNVRIRGGGRPTFESPDSTIALVAAGPNVSVPLPDLSSFDPAALPATSALGGVDISIGSSLFVTDPASGSVVVRAGDFALTGASFIFAVHNDSENTPYPRAVDIAVRDGIRIAEGSAIQAGTVAAGRGGDVWLSGRSIEISDAELLVTTLGFVEPGQGEGSNIHVRGGSLSVSESATITNQTQGTGDAGTIVIDVAELTLGTGGRIASEASDAGNAGAIEIDSELISLRDGAQILSSTSGGGDAGSVSLRAPENASGLELRIANGSLIGTSTQGLGSAGAVSIDASHSVTLQGGASGPALILASARSAEADPTVGNGGDIRVTTSRLALLDGGQITASTNGTGDAGRVEVFANAVEIRGATGQNQSGIFAQSLGEISVGGGRAGGVMIDASGDVSLADGGSILVETRSDKPAGEISILSNGRVTLDAAAISARSQLEDSPAPSGSITIRAAHGVFLSNGSVVGSRSFSQGKAGVVFVDAGPRFEARDSQVSTESITLANPGGGVIEIVADQQIILTDSSVNTSVAAGGGDGGDVRIDPELMVMNRSSIRADALDGNGGNIFIRAGSFVISENSTVSASSLGGGIDGTVVIESPESELNSERAQPAQEFLDAAGLLKTACGGGSGAGAASSFVVAQVAGLPASPEGPLPAPLWDALPDLGRSVVDATPTRIDGASRPLRVAARAGGCEARVEEL